MEHEAKDQTVEATSMHADDKQTLSITIQTTRGSRGFDLPKTAKVADAIAAAVAAFGFAPSDTFTLVLASEVEHAMDLNRTLVSYHVQDGTVLILTAIGSGV